MKREIVKFTVSLFSCLQTPHFFFIPIMNLSQVKFFDRDHSLILLVSLVLILPIMILGIPDNFDVMEHMRFAVTYSDALRDGNILAVWSEKDNFGFGGAGVRLYPPLTYILFSIIHLITGSWHLSLSILLFIGMLIGCLGVYRFTKEFYPNGYPLLAAFVYAVIPYHLFQIYQLFLLAEFMAAAFTPFVFYYGTKLVKFGGIKNSLLFALFFSLVILSYIPSTIILSIALIIFLAIQLRKENLFRTFIHVGVSAILSLTSTSFYWLKVVTEVKWVKHDDVEYYNTGLYTYSAYLFPIILDPPDFYQMKVLWMFDVIVALMLIIFLFLAGYHLVKRKTDSLLTSIIATAGLSLFLTTILSGPIWNNIEFLQKLQFPWRWLSIAMVMLSLLTAAFVQTLKERTEKIGRILLYPMIGIIFVTSLFVVSQILIPFAPLAPSEFNREVDELGSTIGCKCWWPTWTANELNITEEKIIADGRELKITNWENTDRQFTVGDGSSENARIALFYYPYWKAYVNGNKVKPASADDGTLLISLPPNKSDVVVKFVEPTFLRVAKIISLLTWIGLVIAFIAFRKASPSAHHSSIAAKIRT